MVRASRRVDRLKIRAAAVENGHSFGASAIVSRERGAMALTPVTRHLGLFGLLVPLLGCTNGVELLSSVGDEAKGGALVEAAGGQAGGEGGSPAGGSGGTFAVGGSASAAGASGIGCALDSDCSYGSEWCGGGACVPCNGDLPVCEHGWSARAFTRNGCRHFACAPPSACHSSADCDSAKICYGGTTCDEGCASGDPLCCEGNFCASAGCDAAMVPLSCTERGCPLGEHCIGLDWTPPDCDCVGGNWVCATVPEASQCER